MHIMTLIKQLREISFWRLLLLLWGWWWDSDFGNYFVNEPLFWGNTLILPLKVKAEFIDNYRPVNSHKLSIQP